MRHIRSNIVLVVDAHRRESLSRKFSAVDGDGVLSADPHPVAHQQNLDEGAFSGRCDLPVHAEAETIDCLDGVGDRKAARQPEALREMEMPGLVAADFPEMLDKGVGLGGISSLPSMETVSDSSR